jgi:hypothetical protein
MLMNQTSLSPQAGVLTIIDPVSKKMSMGWIKTTSKPRRAICLLRVSSLPDLNILISCWIRPLIPRVCHIHIYDRRPSSVFTLFNQLGRPRLPIQIKLSPPCCYWYMCPHKLVQQCETKLDKVSKSSFANEFVVVRIHNSMVRNVSLLLLQGRPRFRFVYLIHARVDSSLSQHIAIVRVAKHENARRIAVSPHHHSCRPSIHSKPRQPCQNVPTQTPKDDAKNCRLMVMVENETSGSRASVVPTRAIQIIAHPLRLCQQQHL